VTSTTTAPSPIYNELAVKRLLGLRDETPKSKRRFVSAILKGSSKSSSTSSAAVLQELVKPLGITPSPTPSQAQRLRLLGSFKETFVLHESPIHNKGGWDDWDGGKDNMQDTPSTVVTPFDASFMSDASLSSGGSDVDTPSTVVEPYHQVTSISEPWQISSLTEITSWKSIDCARGSGPDGVIKGAAEITSGGGEDTYAVR
jgi:hypothetical protein